MKEEKKLVSVAHISYFVELTREDVDDIMVAALEGGISYWSTKAEVVGKYLADYASEQISRGGSLLIHICDEEEPRLLDLDAFTKGVELLVINGDDKYGAFPGWPRPNDLCKVDGMIADWIIQYALFGEIVFG